MIKVYGRHSHAHLYLISCCSNFRVDTICDTVCVPNLSMFYHLKLIKMVKYPTRIPHKDTKTLSNTKQNIMLWFWIKTFCNNCIFQWLDGEHFCSGNCWDTLLLSIYLWAPSILWMSEVSSLWLFHEPVIILEVTVGHFIQWCPIKK